MYECMTLIFNMPPDYGAGTMFLPFALSTRDLRDKVVEALTLEHGDLQAAGIKVPSCAWLDLQFAPANLGYASALRYTGKFLHSYTCEKLYIII